MLEVPWLHMVCDRWSEAQQQQQQQRRQLSRAVLRGDDKGQRACLCIFFGPCRGEGVCGWLGQYMPEALGSILAGAVSVMQHAVTTGHAASG